MVNIMFTVKRKMFLCARQDVWLDNMEVDPKYAALTSVARNDEEEA